MPEDGRTDADLPTESDSSGDELHPGIEDDRTAGESDVETFFERESVPEIDPDALWEQVRSDDPPDLEYGEREIREVSKAAFCHRCEHFAAPPEVRCENEGTEILELASHGTFRVADCPRILEEEALEENG